MSEPSRVMRCQDEGAESCPFGGHPTGRIGSRPVPWACVLALLVMVAAPGASLARGTRTKGARAGVGMPAQEASAADEHDAATRIARRLGAAIAVSVAKVRELPWRRPVDIGVHDPDSLRKVAVDEVERGTGLHGLRRLGRAWATLGLVPRDLGLDKAWLALLQAQVAGFYLPGSGVMRVSRAVVPVGVQLPNPFAGLFGSSEDKLRFVIAHELVHALGDQRWDFRRFARDRPGETDLEMAIAAVVEGDATLAGLGWAMQDRGHTTPPEALFVAGDSVAWLLGKAMSLARLGLLPDGGGLDRAPRALAERLVFPYVGGTTLVVAAGARVMGWGGVNALYARPPLSTEQVLHPEKILDPKRLDPPIRLRWSVPVALRRSGARLVASDVLGERLIAVILERTHSEEGAARAARNWGGDRLELWCADARCTAIWATVWDTQADAARLARLLPTAVGRSAPSPWAWHQQGRWLVGVASDDPALGDGLAGWIVGHARQTPLLRLPK